MDKAPAPQFTFRSLPWRGLLDRLGSLLVLLGIVVTFSLLNPTFGRADNLTEIGVAAAVIAIVAAGQTFVILTGGVDLSVGSMVGLASVVAAGLMKGSFSPTAASFTPWAPWLAVLCALGAGALVGLMHGLLVTRLKLAPFIVTLGTLSALRGLALVLTNGSPIQTLPPDFKWTWEGRVLGVPAPIVIALAVYLICGFVLRNTRLGRYTYAIGGNEQAVSLSGVNTGAFKTWVYVISGVLAAVAGVILMNRLDSGMFSNGGGYELTSITAVVIGGTTLSGGSGSIWGTLIGVLVISVVNNALVLFSVNPLLNEVVIGALIVLTVTLDQLRRRKA